MICYIVCITFVVVYFLVNAISDDKKRRKQNEEWRMKINEPEVPSKQSKADEELIDGMPVSEWADWVWR